MFEPTAEIDEQAYAKILLTALGYEYNVDFTWDGTLAFAKEKGIASAEKKVITEIENIRYLYGTFENISLDILDEQPNDEADVVILFRFYPSDTASDWLWSEETFDLVYYGYGVKNSVLKMPPNEIYFLTREDVERIWSELYD